VICAPFSPEHTALLLIDVQEEYFLPGGPYELPDGRAALRRAAALLEEARATGVHIVHVRHLCEHPAAEEFRPGTPGAEIRPEVAPASGEPVIDKRLPSAFAGTLLADELSVRGVEAVVVAGFMTGTCCTATAVEAVARGYRTVFASDATATQGLGDREHDEVHERALRNQRRLGSEVLSVATIRGLLRPAGLPSWAGGAPVSGAQPILTSATATTSRPVLRTAR
jgi:nicotinamidase-related amidase